MDKKISRFSILDGCCMVSLSLWNGNCKDLYFSCSCQAVLETSEKVHSKPVADSPLTLAEVTGFMAMEVKLQSSLTEQHAKFIKVVTVDIFFITFLSETKYHPVFWAPFANIRVESKVKIIGLFAFTI